MTEVRAKIDPETKRKVEVVLRPLGLSSSVVIRLMFDQIAATGTLPFEPLKPETIEAIEAARRGETVKFDSIEALFEDLHADD
jgi:DNA-damage-inducible protein J